MVQSVVKWCYKLVPISVQAVGVSTTACMPAKSSVFDYIHGILNITPHICTQLDEDNKYSGMWEHNTVDQVLLQQTWIAVWGRMQTYELEVVVVRILCGDERMWEQLVWVQGQLSMKVDKLQESQRLGQARQNEKEKDEEKIQTQPYSPT
ncbi:hypothetical protein B0H14DRAFT_2654345 [Mycena olivaceomarginata]|nr:hypothetical protein B0H14DRAFT_2654345 [Mycena olivaceomarginata]